MDKIEVLGWGVVLLIIVSLLNLMYGMSTQYVTEEIEVDEYPMYHCTAPFGMIWIEKSASGSFIFIVGSYVSSSEITESYNVKAFSNGELFTKIFDATNVRVVADGTFYLERRKTIWITHDRGGKEIGRQVRSTRYLIHIPELPRLNQTISMEWIFIGS